MSDNAPLQQVTILGDGCAALSLAARADEFPGHHFTIVSPKDAPPPQDHIWGFWGLANGTGALPSNHNKNIVAAAGMARASWPKWSIITEDDAVVMASSARPYHALQRSVWINHCRAEANAASVAFTDKPPRANDPHTAIFDSRPPQVPNGMMLQHFTGVEVRVDRPVFDPGTAILMDFRVDQSEGMHFIYLLPFSAQEALVESTLFTPHILQDDFYMTAIHSYLERHYGVTAFETIRRERGVIPLGMLARRDAEIPGIGGNGGAIRPSSGYAFIFIQKQIEAALAAVHADNGRGGLAFQVPHKSVDLWMDAVFLTVLRNWPDRAPDLFMRMARALSGDQFARFLSGEAGWALRLKVIIAMPKWLFICAVFSFAGLNGRPQQSGSG
ncbi:MAG: lycopene cyclase [Bacteroidetes bacterium]|nr:lycopene cyclase [Bacteroidota bacterium]